ncbi:MAG: dTDP-4-dehydrorhamnose reductase [Phycisphaerae bacterium]|nr:dTDP-4-dehydrorhamnose reductase [Phycisphaerae bacterium]
MKVLLFGVGGQLGDALVETAPPGVDLHVSRAEQLDITDAHGVGQLVQSCRPEVVINAAAFTAVDGAEEEPALAMSVNATAPAHIAESCKAVGARMVHYSTDYVFDGNAEDPYTTSDRTDPLNTYGRSKLEGERLVLEVLGEDALVIRTAWLFASGGANFVHTMLAAFSSGRDLEVVNDQFGTPTWAPDLARASWELIRLDASGVLHFTNEGHASWYEFACRIGELALELDMISTSPVIRPVSTDPARRPAIRPDRAVLDKSGTWKLLGQPARHWEEALELMLKESRDG